MTPQQAVPPTGYGALEREADIYVRKMLALGHAVDLYAGPGTTCKADNVYLASGSKESDEHGLLEKLLERRENYNCVIDISSLHLPGQVADLKSISLFLGDDYRMRPHDEVKNRVYCSKELAYNWDSMGHPIIPNTFYYDADEVPLGDGGGGYDLYVGLIHRKKGINIAVAACKKAGIELRIAGPVADKTLWDAIKDHVTYLGVIGEEGRWDVFGKAKVFMHFPQTCDAGPFGPQEAMLCGTPVIAAPHGGVCSSIVDGVSGFFAFTPQDAAERIGRIDRLDRWQVRQSVIEYADTDRNVWNLLLLCKGVAEGETW